jgi:hypothetical protein
VVVIAWWLDLQLPVQSMLFTTKVVSSNPVHSELYSMQHYVIKIVSDLVDNMHVFMPCLDFTEWSPLQKLQFLIGFMVYGVLRHIQQYFSYIVRDRMVVGFTTTCAINAFHH